MITRRMSQRQYESVVRVLQKHARKEPFQAGYEVDFQAGNALYRLTLHLDKGCRMAVPQALKITRDKGGERYALISAGAVLLALVEIWLSQLEEEPIAYGSGR